MKGKIAIALSLFLCAAGSSSGKALSNDDLNPGPPPCPEYAACEPGLEGYVIEIDERGCEVWGCRTIQEHSDDIGLETEGDDRPKETLVFPTKKNEEPQNAYKLWRVE